MLFLIYDFFELFALFVFQCFTAGETTLKFLPMKMENANKSTHRHNSPSLNRLKLFIESHIHSVSLWMNIYMRIWHFRNSEQICVAGGFVCVYTFYHFFRLLFPFTERKKIEDAKWLTRYICTRSLRVYLIFSFRFLLHINIILRRYEVYSFCLAAL